MSENRLKDVKQEQGVRSACRHFPGNTMMMMMKVEYKHYHGVELMKFPFCICTGYDKLLEEISKRLKLKDGSVNLKYVDEEGDKILIACDDDLKLLPSGKAYVHLFLELKYY
ncbi:hypothetical protein ABFX02_01G105000 [Erythranthe guttata]